MAVSLMNMLDENNEAPKAILLAGSPGAGKSQFIKDKIQRYNLKVLNVDDYYIKILKDQGVSLDFKTHKAADRSKAASAMAQARKEYEPELEKSTKALENVIIDGTAASYNKTAQIKQQLNELGYEVAMLYVYASLERVLERNQDRFEKSGGEDRSLPPAIVVTTWNQVTKNFIPYKELFGNNFIAVVNDDKPLTTKSVDDLVKTFVEPYRPTDTKPKTDAQLKASIRKKQQEIEQIKDFFASPKAQEVIQNSVSKEEASSELDRFLGGASINENLIDWLPKLESSLEWYLEAKNKPQLSDSKLIEINKNIKGLRKSIKLLKSPSLLTENQRYGSQEDFRDFLRNDPWTINLFKKFNKKMP